MCAPTRPTQAGCNFRRSVDAHVNDLAAKKPMKKLAEREKLKMQSLTTLKQHCEELKLPVTGVKPVLIERIMQSLWPATDATDYALIVAKVHDVYCTLLPVAHHPKCVDV
jgi:hypothetical protein